MPCRGCGGKRRSVVANRTVTMTATVDNSTTVLVVYEGDRSGSFGVNSRTVPGRKYRIRRGYPFEVPAGDAWIGTLPGFRVITEEEQREPVLPEEPPLPPTPDFTFGKEPEISVEDLPPRVAKRLDEIAKAKALAPVKDAVGERILQKMAEAGFTSVGEIRRDIEENDGEGLLAIMGLGKTKLARLKEALGVD